MIIIILIIIRIPYISTSYFISLPVALLVTLRIFKKTSILGEGLILHPPRMNKKTIILLEILNFLEQSLKLRVSFQFLMSLNLGFLLEISILNYKNLFDSSGFL